MNTKIMQHQETVFYLIDRETPKIQFEFGYCDFKLQIKSVSFFTDPGFNWQQLINKFEIRVHIISYGKTLNSNIPYSEIIFPLHLFNDPYKNQPVFVLNKYLDKHIFSTSDDLTSIGKIVVNILLIEKLAINESYSLQLEIIKYS